MHLFQNDDDGYREWVRQNPDGYIINVPSQTRKASDLLKFHRGKCPTLNWWLPKPNLTTSYWKLCDQELEPLIEWVKANRPFHPGCPSPVWCSECDPEKTKTPRATNTTSQAVESAPQPPATDLMLPPLNQILYGPPGTGKTYEVIRRAAEIIVGRKIENMKEAKATYDKACAEGRIRFATFHQSFSYEDFIEGIRPVMGEDGQAKFEVRDGVFKEIALDARLACSPFNQGAGVAPSEDDYLRRPKSDDSETGRVWKIADNLLASLGRVPLWKEIVKEAVLAGINPNTAGRQAGDWRKAQGVPKSSPQDDSFAKTASTESNPKDASYVLIIDEINRGNISRIFGELITLIEEDKREGAENALRVTLPSSRELFAVPPNLYILGTMNTADKSLALLDVALRRRFEFEELAPDFSVCVDLPEEMRAVLNQLNERIELRKDRDHRIGHAFFMSVKDSEGFNRVFRRKVVPLLQEYFFNDIDGARFVLGEEGGTSEKGFLRPLKAKVESQYQRNRWRWFGDEEPEMDCWAVLKANIAKS